MSLHKGLNGFVALLIGPVTWFAYFLLGYAVVGAGCELELATSVIRTVALVAALFAGGAIAIAGITAGRQWHLLERNGEPRNGDRERRRFVNLAGLLLNGASLVGVAWLVAGVLIHPLC